VVFNLACCIRILKDNLITSVTKKSIVIRQDASANRYLALSRL
jgi:hypothetical protein